MKDLVTTVARSLSQMRFPKVSNNLIQQCREYCFKCNSVYSAVLLSIRDLNVSNSFTQERTPFRVVWVPGCCAYLVLLLLSLTGCLASPVSTSWSPSLTTCCPERGGVCWDAGQRVGVCWWSPPSLRLPSKTAICPPSSLVTSHVSASLTAKLTS